MPLLSDAAMVLFYDIAGDPADHDDWHSAEHFAERLSVSGFLPASRWVAATSPRYMVLYEVADVAVATSPAYLGRLNAPSDWTRATMPRFRGMVRGFASVVAGAGLGLGGAALALRFTPRETAEADLEARIADKVLPALTRRRGVVGAQLLRPEPPPPMTSEQALRGRDAALPWLLLVTGYEMAVLKALAAESRASHGLQPDALTAPPLAGLYTLHHTACAQEAATR